ncbi:hypothetical protein L1049_023248 [Liquidambar formosana]|uniref:Uncharacterized protein n=1 Tax=Liquidambar formosana TaxID=63359 RepID=A0AAP0RFE7_LIQFO
MASLLLETAQKIFAPQTLRSAAKQSKRCHVVRVRLHRAIKKFLREQEEPHKKRKVLRLSDSFNEIKGIIFSSLLPLPRSSSRIRSSHCNNRSGGRSRARTATSVSSKEMKRPPLMLPLECLPFTLVVTEFSERFVEGYLVSLQLECWILVLVLVQQCGEKLIQLSSDGYLDIEMSISFFYCSDFFSDLKDLPLIRSFDSIQALNQNISKCEREHDLVIVSYLLGEIPSLKDRITIVCQLWDLTRDVLVLIEPGTVSYLKCDHIFYGWKKGFSSWLECALVALDLTA